MIAAAVAVVVVLEGRVEFVMPRNASILNSWIFVYIINKFIFSLAIFDRVGEYSICFFSMGWLKLYLCSCIQRFKLPNRVKTRLILYTIKRPVLEPWTIGRSKS